MGYLQCKFVLHLNLKTKYLDKLSFWKCNLTNTFDIVFIIPSLHVKYL